MRILIVSYFFPPFNVVGAVRVGKMAKFLHAFGHDVRVLTARDQPLQSTLPLEVPAEHVVATSWWNVNRPAEMAAGGRERVAAGGYLGQRSSTSLLARLGALYKTVLNLPDGQVGWYRPAVRGGSRLLREWPADVIVASSPPPTALLVANTLSRRHGVPWVADMRDLWTDAPYYAYPPRRRALEAVLERRVFRRAAGLVTVSEPLRAQTAARHALPTAVVMNGFDPADYPEPAPRAAGGPLHIVYTGMIYPGRRDPSPLFEAMRRLGEAGEHVRVSFYGRYLGEVAELARRHGVQDRVEAHESVPYRDALRLQRQADALLLLPGNEPAANGAYGGKFYEYLGARRPMIVLAGPDNVAAALVAGRGLGLVSPDADGLVEALGGWVARKRAGEQLADLPEHAVAEFTREAQARALEAFLVGVARG
jgi:glycosyltransferase involved in cell wall biosynthesis